MLTLSKPQEADRLIQLAQADVDQRWRLYQQWATPAPAPAPQAVAAAPQA